MLQHCEQQGCFLNGWSKPPFCGSFGLVESARVMWKSILAIDFNCGKYAKDLDTTETLRHNWIDVSIRDGRGPTSGDKRPDSA